MANLKHHPGFWLQDEAAAAFDRAEDERGVLTVNSAGRTEAEQQALINRWDQGGAANRPPYLYAPARPAATSNHVAGGGKAVDVANYKTFAAYAPAYGFIQSFPGSDPVHFDFVGFAPSGNPAKNQVTEDRQNWLLSIGISVGKAGADGIEGDDTRAGYREYQQRLRAYGYTGDIDGRWGPAMQEAHARFYTARQQEAAGKGNLARGSEGDAVRALQTKLRNTYPLYQKWHGVLLVDGKFGAITEAWVKEFQKRSGLKQDGVVGPATRKALGL